MTRTVVTCCIPTVEPTAYQLMSTFLEKAGAVEGQVRSFVSVLIYLVSINRLPVVILVLIRELCSYNMLYCLDPLLNGTCKECSYGKGCVC